MSKFSNFRGKIFRLDNNVPVIFPLELKDLGKSGTDAIPRKRLVSGRRIGQLYGARPPA